MIAYDPLKPLIFIHVPKCAGTSIRQIAAAWFGAGFHNHYVLHTTGEHPAPIDFSTQLSGVPQIVFGHFDSTVHLGIHDQYPEVRQFVTLLRDPLDTAISTYYYLLKRAEPMWRKSPRAIANWVRRGGLSINARNLRRAQCEKIRSYNGVEAFVLETGSQILNHFPVEITDENYVEVIETMFVEIGVVEHLEESMHRIAKALGKENQLPEIPHLNRSRKADSISKKVLDEFRQRNALTYKVYDYVLKRFSDVDRGA